MQMEKHQYNARAREYGHQHITYAESDSRSTSQLTLDFCSVNKSDYTRDVEPEEHNGLGDMEISSDQLWVNLPGLESCTL